MSKDGRKTSFLCIAGLVVAILSLAILIFPFVLKLFLDVHKIPDEVFLIRRILLLILPFPALLLSVAGFKTCQKQNSRGRRAAVAGIIIASFEISIIILWFAVVSPYLSKANTTPPDYTIRMHTDVESIRAAKERAFPSTESTIKRPLEENFHLTLGADNSITRDAHEGFRNLGWHIERNGECVLERAAENELVLDPKIQRKYCSEGKITIYLTAVVDGHYQRVSNILEFAAEKDKPKESE